MEQTRNEEYKNLRRLINEFNSRFATKQSYLSFDDVVGAFRYEPRRVIHWEWCSSNQHFFDGDDYTGSLGDYVPLAFFLPLEGNDDSASSLKSYFSSGYFDTRTGFNRDELALIICVPDLSVFVANESNLKSVIMQRFTRVCAPLGVSSQVTGLDELCGEDFTTPKILPPSSEEMARFNLERFRDLNFA